MKFWDKQHRGIYLLSVLDAMRANPLTCDFEVRFNGNKFPTHRIVLIASSGYFRRILQSNSQEAVQGFVDLRDFDTASVNDCLEYLYTGEIDVTFNTVEPLLRTCQYLEIDEIKTLCFAFFKSNLSPSDCFQILEYATIYHSPNTMDAAVRFIAKSYKNIIETRAYQQAELDIVIEIMRTCHAYTTSMLWRGIMRWIEYEPDTRKRNLTKMLKAIKTYGIKFTLDVVANHPLVIKDQEATEYLVTSVIFDQWAFFKRYINEGNCFLVYKWTTVYNFDTKSELFRSVVFEYFEENFIVICQNEKFSSLTISDLYALLNSAQTKLICQTVRWQAIVKWVENAHSNATNFEKLFSLVDLKNLLPEFIRREIRSYELVQRSHFCKDAILDAMFLHAHEKPSVNSCLLFDKMSGKLYCHYADSWKNFTSDSRLIGGSLLGLKGEVFVLNSPNLYKIRRDGRVEVKQPCPDNEVVKIAVVHSGKIYVFHEEMWLWIYDITEGKWKFWLYGFDVPDDTSVCSTENGILFLGGGNDGRFRKLYIRDCVLGEIDNISPMKYKRRNASAASVGNVVFLVGGIVEAAALSSPIEIYCIKTNSWSTFVHKLQLDRFKSKLVCCCESNAGIYLAIREDNAHGDLLKGLSKSQLLIKVTPDWMLSDFSNAPQVNHPEIARWICYE